MEPTELIARRTALGLSQGRLASMMGVSQAKIAHMERGARQVPRGFDAELAAIEDRLAARVAEFVAQATSGATELVVVGRDDPLDLVAAARASAQLRASGQPSVGLREFSQHELATLAEAGDPAAAGELGIRSAGQDLIRTTLAGLGYRFTGRDGWYILAARTRRGTVGFVNIAHGVAVSTEVPIPADIAHSLTIPDQGQGPQASGAVAWAEWDVGEARNATMPEGWVQMLTDIRFGPDPSTVKRILYAGMVWGLQTCYRTQGIPGWVNLACGTDRERLHPSEWPTSGDIEGMKAAAQRAQMAITARFLSDNNLDEIVELLPDPRSALQALPKSQRGDLYTVENMGGGIGHVVADAMASVKLAELARLASPDDETSVDYLGKILPSALGGILRKRLTPIAHVLAEPLEPFVDDRGYPTRAHQVAERQIASVVYHVLPHIALELLRDVDGAEGISAAHAAYLAGGPVESRIYRHP